jgi:hypothetical protein
MIYWNTSKYQAIVTLIFHADHPSHGFHCCWNYYIIPGYCLKAHHTTATSFSSGGTELPQLAVCLQQYSWLSACSNTVGCLPAAIQLGDLPTAIQLSACLQQCSCCLSAARQLSVHLQQGSCQPVGSNTVGNLSTTTSEHKICVKCANN